MFESQELVSTYLFFEFVANEMQFFFDLLHIFFEDRDAFFQFATTSNVSSPFLRTPQDPLRIL